MKKKTKILIMSILFLCLILILTNGISYAKYASNSVWNYYLEAKRFYMSSDYLGVTPIDNVNNNWDGNNIYFNIKNSDNKNLITDYDINYRVECTTNNPNVICKINKRDTNIFNGTLPNIKKCVNVIDEVDVSNMNQSDCEISGYTWEKVESIKELYFTLSSESEIDEVTATITVNGTSPYRKTLIGNFILKKDKSLNGSIDIKYNNYADYDRLVITNNYLENKCMKVSWDSTKLAIDTPLLNIKESGVDSLGYINYIIFELSNKNSTSFKYYKLDSIIHTSQDFTLLEVDC